MFKIFMDYSFIFLIAISMIVQFLRVIYLLFKPTFMSKYKFFSDYTISKYRLSIYYILAIAVGYYIIFKKISG